MDAIASTKVIIAIRNQRMATQPDQRLIQAWAELLVEYNQVVGHVADTYLNRLMQHVVTITRVLEARGYVQRYSPLLEDIEWIRKEAWQ